MSTIHIPDDSQDLRNHLDTSVWKFVQPSETLAATQQQAPPFVLYAMISTWYESDIVEAAVRNCFAHGCERVYILDNNSPDGTADIAQKAGAVLALSYSTDFYRDELRIGLLNKTMKAITEEERHSRLWWICLDCDEFIQVPGQQRLVDWLKYLNPRCNCVGAMSFDHYPTDKPENIPGFHPAVFQPYGMLRHLYVCKNQHWKHPLLRYDNGNWNICHTRGLHAPFVKGGEKLIGPQEGLFLHHFMFREEEFTRQRLKELCQPKPELQNAYRSIVDDNRLNGEGAIKRFKNLDLIYSQQWGLAELCHAQAFKLQHGIPVRHWSKLMSARDYHPLLWHTDEESRLAADQWRAKKAIQLIQRQYPEPTNPPSKDPPPEMFRIRDVCWPQFIGFEIARNCNRATEHCRACPSADLDRYGKLDTSMSLDDNTIVACVQYAYDNGFNGHVVWHYYNEPLLSWKRLKPLILRIRESVPKSLFALWTNGDMIRRPWEEPQTNAMAIARTSSGIDPDELSVFHTCWVSNYANIDWSFLKTHVTRLITLSGALDNRKQATKESRRTSCLRPFNELILDCYGNAHLCCADWKGTAGLGNVFRDGYEKLVSDYIAMRDLVASNPMPRNCPSICKTCQIKDSSIGQLVPEMVSQQQIYVKTLQAISRSVR